MIKIARFVIYIVLAVGLLLVFVVIHELGHTVTARWLGDPESTFYLVRIDESGTCLGCNITDHTKISSAGNLLVSLSGWANTSLVGLGLMFISTWRRLYRVIRRWLLRTGLAYVFLDSLVQGTQGLLYNIGDHTWPTNVDVMDVLLLLQQFTGWSQVVMKTGLFLVLVLYLTGAVFLFRRFSRWMAMPNEAPNTV